MASLQAPPPTATTPTAYSSSSLYSRSLLAKPSKVFINGKHYPSYNISCKSSSNDNNTSEDQAPQSTKFDRRNVLLGLGGLYGAAASFSASNLSAVAAPIDAPVIKDCGSAEIRTGVPVPYTCCPPDAEIIDFQFPPSAWLKRTRPAAHTVSKEYIDKFNRAIGIMKNLPEDDPRNFLNQAKVHCAYCNGAYDQVGFGDLDLQIHSSWLFFPFHRWYLYFFERILGNLIGDPNFALPYWNWDAPAGMKIPPMYLDVNSQLYDQFRNANHIPMIVDLNYAGAENTDTDEARITNNLAAMYKTMYTNATTGCDFFGGEYRAGTSPNPKQGSIESIPHTPVHRWVGDPEQSYQEDMGNFYSAAKDTVFYGHHANVDRMWNIWKTLDPNNKDLADTDWLDTTFLFYNEDKKLVRVKVRDSLDTAKLGYSYEKVDIPWMTAKPVPRAPGSNAAANAANTAAAKVVFPVKLDKDVKVLVSRPKKARSRKAKDEASEVLVIEGIDYDTNKYVKFDVFINDEDIDGTHATPAQTEFAGSFTNLPHHHKHGKRAKSNIHFGLTDILEDLEAEDDENVLVTLVPKSGSEDITISGIKIKLASRK
ncbi:hypothetical protein LguiB_002751 [Lonicera macranthoides]